MDIDKVIADLCDYLLRVDEAIRKLEQLEFLYNKSVDKVVVKAKVAHKSRKGRQKNRQQDR